MNFVVALLVYRAPYRSSNFIYSRKCSDENKKKTIKRVTRTQLGSLRGSESKNNHEIILIARMSMININSDEWVDVVVVCVFFWVIHLA